MSPSPSPDLPPILADLLRPANWPAPQPRQVSLVSTHISWVLLTPDEAWKLKRPVDFGFLDYTSAVKRRHFCEEEVRLNRRLAPDVYLGVAPVFRDRRGYSFARRGEIVDWAVRMRRLPDAASARARLAAGTLSHDDLARVARALAPFFRDAREEPSFGTADAILTNVRENFAQVEPFVGRLVPRERFDRVRDAQLTFLRDRRADLDARAAAGRIREGHGDLRLEHVYFIGESPAVIDGIEFSERFRFGDVASDIAFLATELIHEGRGDLGEGFLASFAAESGDFDLYSVVDFYVGYRAWVRAKIACFVAADPGTPPDKQARKREEAAALFSLSDAASGPQFRPPWVVAIGGVVGSGKSTVAEGVSRATGFPVVGSDATRKTLAGLATTERGGTALYSDEHNRRTFDEVFRRAGAVARSGRGVVLDATFRSADLRRRARAFANERRLPFLFVETRCSEAVERERLRRRSEGPSVSDAGPDLLDRVRKEWEPVTELAEGEVLVTDTTAGASRAVGATLRALGIATPPPGP